MTYARHGHPSARHGHPAVAPKADASTIPIGTELARDSGQRFLAMGNAPPIKREAGGPTDRLRLSFLRFVLPRLARSDRLAAYAAEMGRSWGSQLAGYPAAYLGPGQAPASAAELLAAMAVLLRTGLVVVEGLSQNGVSRSELRISLQGRDFIAGEEGDGARLYWPQNDLSGVTLGPGYDMGRRLEPDITATLAAIGVPANVAKNIGTDAAGKLGPDADTFVRQHKNAISLTRTQQLALFDRIAPDYERLVCNSLPRSLPPRLFQHEFDALASLAWNTARFGHYGVNNDLRRLDLVSASVSWRTLIGGGPGILDRRRREITQFEDAVYMKKPLPLRASDLDADGGDHV